MECLPLELWIRIAAFACTDGGYTGRSLSLVSYLMRDITRPSRYHSVALIGFRSYLAFVDSLDRLETEPTIHHLFFSFPSNLRTSELNILHRISEGFLLASFRRILTVASSTLQTLHAPSFLNIRTAWPVLPVLTHITIRSTISLPEVQMDECLPSLTRLHVWDGCISWSHLTSSASSLTHLALSNVQSSTDVPAFLRILLDIPAPLHLAYLDDLAGTFTHYKPGSQEALRAECDASQLPHLRSIFIRSKAFGSPRSWRTRRTHRGSCDRTLVDIARACASGRGSGKLYLLPSGDEYTHDEALSDWLEVINGGDGVWSPELSIF